MTYVVLAVLLAIAAFVVPNLPVFGRVFGGGLARAARIVAFACFATLALLAVLATSVVSIPADQVGVVRTEFGFKTLPAGHYIATEGENGYQADVIAPGTFMISPFYNVINTVTNLPLVVIPQGFYGRVVANDGEPLAPGQIMADPPTDSRAAGFIDAKSFLKLGGRKGLQLAVLKPGTYPINLALFRVRIGYRVNGRDVTRRNDDLFDLSGLTHEDSPLDTSITVVPTGSVGVVRSNVQTPGKDCHAEIAKTENDGLTAEVVPEGCKGVWNSSLPPNDYYLNRDAYDVTLISTRVTTLEFKGGFTRRYIDLEVNAKGEFLQREHAQDFLVPTGAADQAIGTKIEGWEVPQELRAVVQITPEHAPVVVAAVGGQEEIDRRIVIPSIRSRVRNVFGGEITVTGTDKAGQPTTTTRPTEVLDTINHRQDLEQEILKTVQVDGRRAGVDIKEIRLGESAIPPELLLARQRQQLAGQLKQAYEQEQIAQEQRQKSELAKATADQQPELVRAQIGVATARLNAERRKQDGVGEQEYLEAIAAGQKAQSDVLGQEGTLRLQTTKLYLDALAAHPEILSSVKLPEVLVVGSGSGLEAPAGILGKLLGGVGQGSRPREPASDSEPAR